jgi:hypothetical protein
MVCEWRHLSVLVLFIFDPRLFLEAVKTESGDRDEETTAYRKRFDLMKFLINLKIKMGSREDNIYKARLAEQGERYEDMINFMKNVASVSPRPS